MAGNESNKNSSFDQKHQLKTNPSRGKRPNVWREVCLGKLFATSRKTLTPSTGCLSGNGSSECLSEDRRVCSPLAGGAHGDGGRRLRARALFTAVWGGKQADVNEGWRFHEAQLVDGRFNVTGLNWAMIRTVCKIHFLAGLCPPASSSKRSSPSPSSYAFESNENWTRHCCALFLLTTITFKRKEKTISHGFLLAPLRIFFFFNV